MATITVTVNLDDGRETSVEVPLSEEEFQSCDAGEMSKLTLEPAYACAAANLGAAWSVPPTMADVERILKAAG